MTLTAEQIIKYAKGNPGALSFLFQLTNSTTITETILKTLREAKTIRGTNIWVLYSYLSDKNIQTVFVYVLIPLFL
jgi:hypothetical protein